VQPKAEVMPPFRAPSMHPNTSVFIGLGPVRLPDKAPFIPRFEAVLPLTLVTEFDSEGFVVCIWRYRYVSPHL
jgi:hypothetical protein